MDQLFHALVRSGQQPSIAKKVASQNQARSFQVLHARGIALKWLTGKPWHALGYHWMSIIKIFYLALF